ncbi:MAG: hypothetical protein AAF349_08800 [Cyanobacteria bacterium P01_A01_bin.68]
MNSKIENKRGFDLKDYACSFGYVLVKAPIDEVSSTFAKLKSATLIKDVYDNSKECSNFGFLVWQYFGHHWTMFECGVCESKFPQNISGTLGIDAIYYEYEDTSDWEGYTFFRNSVNIEDYGFGTDSFEEMIESGEYEGEEFDLQVQSYYKDCIKGEDRDYIFSFKSTIRNASDDEIKNENKFLNDFFISQNAWLPDYNFMPYVDENDEIYLPKSLFSRVDLVKA